MANSEEAARQLHDEVLKGMKPGMHEVANCPYCSPGHHRETASEGGGKVAGEGTSTTVDLNDPAIKAIVDSRVETATADLRTRAEKAEQERDEKQTRLDVLEAEKATAEQAKTTAEQELASFREEVTNERASASRRDTRKAALVEKVPHLTDEWFGQEVAKNGDVVVTRLDRMAGMTDEAFTEYVSEIASAFAGLKVEPGKPGETAGAAGAPPRETAMAGAAPTGGSDKSASSSWIANQSAFGRR